MLSLLGCRHCWSVVIVGVSSLLECCHCWGVVSVGVLLLSGSRGWNVPMFDIHLLWIYCPGQAGVKGND